MKIVSVIIVVIIALVILPIGFLWSINTLSVLGGSEFMIPITGKSWFASMVLLVLVSGISSTLKH